MPTGSLRYARTQIMPSAEELKARIEAALPGSTAEVEDWTGGGDHFRAVVVAPQGGESTGAKWGRSIESPAPNSQANCAVTASKAQSTPIAGGTKGGTSLSLSEGRGRTTNRNCQPPRPRKHILRPSPVALGVPPP